MQLINKIRRKQQCPRCGLDYLRSEEVCPHCTGLSDRDVEDLKRRFAAKGTGERYLELLFIYIAALIIVGMLIFSLRG